MAGKYLNVKLHMIWSTKNRQRALDPQWAGRLYAFLASIAIAKKAKLIEVNSEPDHIHLYIAMPSTVTIAEMINALKANSSRWIHENFANRRFFSWQEGYAALSVGPSEEQAVLHYIRNQREHHRKRDFQQEFLEILRRHGIEYDPRYVFD